METAHINITKNRIIFFAKSMLKNLFPVNTKIKNMREDIAAKLLDLYSP